MGFVVGEGGDDSSIVRSGSRAARGKPQALVGSAGWVTWCWPHVWGIRHHRGHFSIHQTQPQSRSSWLVEALSQVWDACDPPPRWDFAAETHTHVPETSFSCSGFYLFPCPAWWQPSRPVSAKLACLNSSQAPEPVPCPSPAVPAASRPANPRSRSGCFSPLPASLVGCCWVFSRV